MNSMSSKDSFAQIIRQRDVFFSRVVALYFIIMIANYSLKSFFQSQPGMVSLIHLSMMSILIVSMLWGLIKAYNLIRSIVIKSYVIGLLFLLIGLILNYSHGYSSDVLLRENAVWLLGLWIPLGCTTCSIMDKGVLYKVLLRASYIMVFFLFFSFITRDVYQENGLVSYNMSYGTYCLLPFLLHLNEFIKSKKVVFFCLAAYELYTILIYGNRGVLLSIAFFVFLYFIFAKNSKTKVIFMLLGFSLLSVAFVFGDTILDFVSSANINSRTIYMLTSGDIALSSERDELRLISLGMIKEHPILGWGFGGEYYEIAKRFGEGADAVSSAFNPHNGVIQNLVEFGLIMGSFVTFLIIKPLFKIRTVENGARKDLLIVFGSYAVVTRLVSAAGFFIHPDVAVFLYLYYFRNLFMSKLVNHEQDSNLLS